MLRLYYKTTLKKIMDLKGYHCLADLFGKLNSQEKLEDDFTTIPEGGKLKFFWKNAGMKRLMLLL